MSVGVVVSIVLSVVLGVVVGIHLSIYLLIHPSITQIILDASARYNGLIGRLMNWIGTSSSALVVVLVIWGIFLVNVYLLARVLAARSMKHRFIPMAMLSIIVAADLFTGPNARGQIIHH